MKHRNLVPGGWIEEVETSVGAYCDEGTISPDSLLAKSGPMFLEPAEKMGKPLEAIDKCRSRIEAAGFINVHERCLHGTAWGVGEESDLQRSREVY